MTRDFRQPSMLPGQGQPGQAAPGRDDAAARGRRIVIRMLSLTALLFLGLGLWLFFARPDFLPPDVQPLVALALIVVAVSDWVAVGVLKRLWASRDRADPDGNRGAIGR